jgi:hypothetical protein
MLRSIGARALTDNNKKKTQTPLGQQTQKQTGKQGNQGKHYNVNNASQLNNPSHLKGQGQHHGYMRYNFCRIHQTLRVTPAMEAGITNYVWSLDEVIALLDLDYGNERVQAWGHNTTILIALSRGARPTA